MKQFIGQVQTRTVSFMDGEVEVKTLTVGGAKAIDLKTKELAKKKDASDMDQLELLRFIIRTSVVGAEEMTDEEIDGFPMTELTKLAEGVMGVTGAPEGKG
jgi:hypothetical protein